MSKIFFHIFKIFLRQNLFYRIFYLCLNFHKIRIKKWWFPSRFCQILGSFFQKKKKLRNWEIQKITSLKYNLEANPVSKSYWSKLLDKYFYTKSCTQKKVKMNIILKTLASSLRSESKSIWIHSFLIGT